jgi:two-component system OmpR family sensor kinase
MAGIRRETGRMAGLVDDLLLLARLDERRPLTQEAVDLTEVVFAGIDAARTVDPDRPIRVRIGDVITVRGDAGRLRQVVDNLLANVRAHTPPGTGCEVGLATDGTDAVLTVTDAGPGVAADDLDHLFDRFYRIDDARARSTGGSGLGLAIVDAIVRAHHGSLTACNVEPHGLALTIRLPFDPPDPQEIP